MLTFFLPQGEFLGHTIIVMVSPTRGMISPWLPLVQARGGERPVPAPRAVQQDQGEGGAHSPGEGDHPKGLSTTVF